MTKDVFFYYPCETGAVYQAYLRTANEQFAKVCKEEIPGAVISFGLDFSFKYNMNGGACTIHFMPHQSGTAVAIRYTVVQLLGARVSKHSSDLTSYADRILGAAAQPAQLTMNLFTGYESSYTPAVVRQPIPQVAPAGARMCPHCGAPLSENARFCSSCGKAADAAPQRVCPSCSRQLSENDIFCPACGTKCR